MTVSLWRDALWMSAAASAVYLLLKAASRLLGPRVSEAWRWRALRAAALLFLLPVHWLWRPLLPLLRSAGQADFPPAVAWAQAPEAAGALTAGAADLPPLVWWAAGQTAAKVLPVLWAAGIVLLALWRGYCFLRFRLALRRARTVEDDTLRRTARQAAQARGVRRPVRLLRHPDLEGPALVGYFRPAILLPARFPASEEEATLILAHELTHYRRGDLWWKLLFTVLRTVYWWDPVLYWMRRDLDLWAETSCDEAIVREMDPARRKRYGHLLISYAGPAGPSARVPGIPLISSKEMLKRRISIMLNSNRGTGKRAGILTACVLCAVCLVVTALAANGSEKTRTSAFYEGFEPTEHDQYIALSTAPTVAPVDNYDTYIGRIKSGALPALDPEHLTAAYTDGSDIGLTEGDGCPALDLTQALEADEARASCAHTYCRQHLYTVHNRYPDNTCEVIKYNALVCHDCGTVWALEPDAALGDGCESNGLCPH